MFKTVTVSARVLLGHKRVSDFIRQRKHPAKYSQLDLVTVLWCHKIKTKKQMSLVILGQLLFSHSLETKPEYAKTLQMIPIRS